MEQIKSSSEIREKIIAHAREARKSPSYPAELNSENIFSNYGDLRRLSGLDNILSHAHGVGVTTEKQMIDEEKHLWIDTQSHTSSASSDSHDSDCGLGYPTGFYTQFKVGICVQCYICSTVHCRMYNLSCRFYHKEISKKHDRECWVH